MKTLPLLLSACVYTNTDLTDSQREQCEPEIQSLQESCEAQNGTFKSVADEARECFGQRVQILCSNPGTFEPKKLYIGNLPK